MQKWRGLMLTFLMFPRFLVTGAGGHACDFRELEANGFLFDDAILRFRSRRFDAPGIDGPCMGVMRGVSKWRKNKRARPAR